MSNGWTRDFYFQFPSSQVYFAPRFPCEPAQNSYRSRVSGEAGAWELLETTIKAPLSMTVDKGTKLERVVVDKTVLSKAIAQPTRNRLLECRPRRDARLAKH